MVSVTIGQLKYLKYIWKNFDANIFAHCVVFQNGFNLEGDKKLFHKTSV